MRADLSLAMSYASSKDGAVPGFSKNWNVALEDQITDALAFLQKRHVEKIEGTKPTTQHWRSKERVSVKDIVFVFCGAGS